MPLIQALYMAKDTETSDYDDAQKTRTNRQSIGKVAENDFGHVVPILCHLRDSWALEANC